MRQSATVWSATAAVASLAGQESPRVPQPFDLDAAFAAAQAPAAENRWHAGAWRHSLT